MTNDTHFILHQEATKKFLARSSIYKLADETGVGPGTLNLLIKGKYKKKPLESTVVSLARALGVDRDEVITPVPNPN